MASTSGERTSSDWIELVADALRHDFVVFVFRTGGDLADLQGEQRQLLHAFRAEEGLHLGEIGLQFFVGARQRGIIHGESTPPDDEVGAHVLAGGAGHIDDLRLVDVRPSAGEDKRGEAEAGSEEQACEQAEKMRAGVSFHGDLKVHPWTRSAARGFRTEVIHKTATRSETGF